MASLYEPLEPMGSLSDKFSGPPGPPRSILDPRQRMATLLGGSGIGLQWVPQAARSKLLSDADGAGLEAWVVAAHHYATSSHDFVARSSELSIASLDAAKIIDASTELKSEQNGGLAQGLRDLSALVEEESRQQRDRHPATAAAIAELSKLFDEET